MTVAAFDHELINLLAATESRARELADISWRRLKYWDFRDLVKPSIRKRMGATRSIRLYSFDDLVALMVVAQLRGRNMSLPQLKSLVAHLNSRGFDKPLSQLTFATHDRDIYFQYPDGSWAGDRVPDQTVIREVIPLTAIRNYLLENIPARDADPGTAERVRGRVGSKPVFAGTRIPVSTITRWLEHGASREEILAAYPELTDDDVELASTQLAGTSI